MQPPKRWANPPRADFESEGSRGKKGLVSTWPCPSGAPGEGRAKPAQVCRTPSRTGGPPAADSRALTSSLKTRKRQNRFTSRENRGTPMAWPANERATQAKCFLFK
ncbi:hypothetical protein CIRG_05218 [Coccidioides immitis RMSCC 2394]|uniref:Uncharacterized protein n=1 Tax=Coccidioides immitis RMSCC 2394 TaxID=404692 RepID=A0A0J7B6H2_COCIT|nr:hypothetical protein CIRG_05218 [Coccidioides immitis RMSCC 2394]